MQPRNVSSVFASSPPTPWAAIYVDKGLYDLTMRDLEAGLALAPGSPTLHESVRILQWNKRLVGRKVVPS